VSRGRPIPTHSNAWESISMTIYTRQNPPIGFYVYAYLREDGTPYYIGKGEKLRAWKPHRRRNGTDLLPKHKDRIVILYDNLTELWSIVLERKLIRWYGRKDLSTGILVNLTEGGEGATGRLVTDLQKSVMREIMKGRSPSEKTREAVSLARKGAKDTPETREKKRLVHLGKPKKIVSCPHCDVSGGEAAMYRWHFTNCKKVI
jgi:hypothetical protein